MNEDPIESNASSEPAPEISKEQLEELLKSKGKNLREIKTLEINPGSVIAKQYDR